MLDLARRIEGRLSAIGVTVLFTRSGSTSPDDLERAAFANDAGADVLLSLHCDSTDQPQAGGVATFFYGQDRFGAWSAIGEQLADLVQREIVARTGLTDCRSHPRAWSLLQRTRMPAVRIEAGYLTHAEDAALLAQPQFRDTLAEAVVVALQRTYLGEDDTNATGTLDLRRPAGLPGVPDRLTDRGTAGTRAVRRVAVRDVAARTVAVRARRCAWRRSGGVVRPGLRAGVRASAPADAPAAAAARRPPPCPPARTAPCAGPAASAATPRAHAPS